jgi:hypothetical protein
MISCLLTGDGKVGLEDPGGDREARREHYSCCSS